MAGNADYQDGLLYWSDGASIFVTDASSSINLLNGYFPATIGSADAATINDNYRNFSVYGRPVRLSDADFISWEVNPMYVEVLFSVPAPLTVSVSGVSSEHTASVQSSLQLVGVNASGQQFFNGQVAYPYAIECVYDTDTVSLTGTAPNFVVPSGSHEVKRYFGYRYYFSYFQDTKSIKNSRWVLRLDSNFNGKYTFSDPNYVEVIYDQVTVNTGILQEINGTLTDIKTSTAIIQGDVSEIKGGLQDSNSSIWGAFKDSISGLFVPSSGDLESVKDGFDRLAQDKLGGAYQTVDMVSGGVQSVTDKFKNPGSSPGVEFPGISVPLGGDVGTVTLAASQTVTIPEKITNVLYPVSGVIIPIVCTIWTVRLGLDMVNCFMSGMSYGDFLHRHTDEEDNEV